MASLEYLPVHSLSDWTAHVSRINDFGASACYPESDFRDCSVVMFHFHPSEFQLTGSRTINSLSSEVRFRTWLFHTESNRLTVMAVSLSMS